MHEPVRRRRSAGRRLPAVSVVRGVRSGWVPSQRQLSRWAAAALGRGAAGREICVLLVGATRSRALNARYRGRDRATNVLAFAAEPTAVQSSGLLGDLVVCPSLVRAEARAQRKPARAHWAHLVVHGALHLLGYDHQGELEAQRMERREIRALRALGLPNPYLQAAPRARRSA
jgi:probable rRNA maturation factor